MLSSRFRHGISQKRHASVLYVVYFVWSTIMKCAMQVILNYVSISTWCEFCQKIHFPLHLFKYSKQHPMVVLQIDSEHGKWNNEYKIIDYKNHVTVITQDTVTESSRQIFISSLKSILMSNIYLSFLCPTCHLQKQKQMSCGSFEFWGKFDRRSFSTWHWNCIIALSLSLSLYFTLSEFFSTQTFLKIFFFSSLPHLHSSWLPFFLFLQPLLSYFESLPFPLLQISHKGTKNKQT